MPNAQLPGSLRMGKKTSVTHPLEIATVSAGQALGRIGITFCPGRYDPDDMSGAWDRDVSADLDAIRGWGACAVVTLIETHEFALLRVPKLGEEVKRREMAWFHLPIADGGTPDIEFERAWDATGEKLRSMLQNRSDILVHCRAGLGRAGTIAARLLVELGMEPQIAIATVRAARPGAIGIPEQERFVTKIRPV